MQAASLDLDVGRVNEYVRRLGHDSLPDYQRWFGLKPDGVIGPKTSSRLMEKRCGVPDNLALQHAQIPRNCMDVPVAWEFDEIDAEVAAKAWKLAIDKWNAACGLRAHIVESIRDAIVWATDGPLPGGTLAWSMFPRGCKDKIEERYDTEEIPYLVLFLAKIILHELGHAWGLEHSNKQDDIMFPSISNRPWSSYLSQNDIARVVEKYGPSTDPPPPDEDDDEKVLFEYTARTAGQKIRLVTGRGLPDWGV